MKKDICVDARMATFTGIGTYLRSLLSQMVDAHHWKLLIDEKSLSQCPELASFDVILTKTPIYSIQEQILLPLLVPKCDLFWSPHFNIPLAPIRAKHRMATIHDVFFLAHPEHLAFHKLSYARLFFRMALERSDHVVTVSQFSRSEICKYVGPFEKKITPIHLGVDAKKFSDSSLDVEEGISLPSKYILFVGNLSPNKNITNLVASLDFLSPDVHLVLVGKEFKWSAWKEKAKKYESRITLCGRVSEATLVRLYRHATMLVHPSIYEGFGLTPLEAMSVGCPVVVSCAASLPEVCGGAAIYVDPLSTQSIAEGIQSVWDNEELRKDLQSRGRKRIESFDWKISAQRHLEVIDRILSK